MKKSLNILFIALMVFQFSCNTESEESIITPNNYIKIIEGTGADDPIAIRILSDGNLLIVTNSVSFNTSGPIRQIRLLKLNLEGTIIIEKYYPDSEQYWLAGDVSLLQNNEIVIASTIQNRSEVDSSLLFLKIDENLEIVVSKTYENDATYSSIAVEESNGEILFIAQETKPTDAYPIVGRLNPVDLKLIEPVGQATKYDQAPATKVLRNSAGEYVWAYNRASSYLAKVQPDLLQVNDQKIMVPGEETRAKKLLMKDGNPIVFGEVRDNDRNRLFYYNQNSGTSYVFGGLGNTLLNNVQATEDGFLVTGYQELPIEGSEDGQSNFFLSRRDGNGVEVFSKTFGSNENEELSDAVMINDGIYTIGKTVFGGENTLVLIKTDALGQLKN